jgi:hypothetical protein
VDRRRQCSTQLGAGVLALAVALLAGCGNESASVAEAHSFSSRINLGSGISLDPAPPGANPRRSAEDAWAVYSRGAPSQEVPSDMTVRLGLLNGSGETNRLVWSYEESTIRSCMYSALPSPPPGVTFSPRPPDCLGWTFLDANSGHHVLDTQVPVRTD